MHPAYSVIFFTTASGAGYGMLILLAAGLLGGGLPYDALFGSFAFALAFGLVVAGLLSSTAHLGRPERAWRAFSQWRSSWLSREGIVSVATFAPSGLLALWWIFDGVPPGGKVPGWVLLMAVLTIAGSFATLYCTGMIYASLRTIRQWHVGLLPFVYIGLGLMTGAIVLGFLLRIYGVSIVGFAWLTLLLIALGFALKAMYWMSIDARKPAYTAEEATGLGHIGKVHVLEPAHSQPNFVMREMGFSIARKHVARLRKLTFLLAFALPLLGTLPALFGGPVLALFGAFVALATAAVGIFIERWLFFAEAEHVVMLYYGAEAA